MECPICRKSMENYYIYADEHGINEESASCKDKNHSYGYEFAYGSWREKIGSVEITGGYESDFEEEDAIIRLAIDLERKKYKSKVGNNGRIE